MKIQTIYLAYTDLTPGLQNQFVDETHKSLIKTLRVLFKNWDSFFQKHGKDFSIGFYISTQKGTDKLKLLGPSISKKMEIVDYTMFIPDDIQNLDGYINMVFEGFEYFLARYGINKLEIETMKNDCKKELDLL
jgi:hypothetical protein